MSLRRRIRIVVAILLALGPGLGWFGYRAIWSNNVVEGIENYDLFISSDTPFEAVTEQLKEDSVLRSVASFRWVASLKRYDRKIKSGRYRLYSGMSNNDMVNLLRSGGQTPVRITFNNIDHIYELAEVVSSQLEADSAELVQLLSDPIYLDSRGWNEETILGAFLPNTYEMYWNTSAEGFVDRMFQEYEHYWDEERQMKAASLGMNPNQVSALASIVERETVQPAEMKTVAGLYLNRLRRGWKLQSDPTIVFILKQLNPDTVIRRVLTKDLQIESPYNTYLNAGLPPGPIGAPSLRAIEAVLANEQHNYMYMCASVDRAGYHEFASTLSEHNRNAARYRQWLNQQRLYR